MKSDDKPISVKITQSEIVKCVLNNKNMALTSAIKLCAKFKLCSAKLTGDKIVAIGHVHGHSDGRSDKKQTPPNIKYTPS